MQTTRRCDAIIRAAALVLILSLVLAWMIRRSPAHALFGALLVAGWVIWRMKKYMGLA